MGQIYGSIEAQHQRTILIDFIDHLADFDRFGRADMRFAKDDAIGVPLISLSAVQDLRAAVQSAFTNRSRSAKDFGFFVKAVTYAA